MNNDWRLLFPRLDASFKEGPVPEKYYTQNIPAVRIPWLSFGEIVINAANQYNAKLLMDVKPLWQFREEDYVDVPESNLLIPHKEFHNFKVPGKRNFYYMQSVIPTLFSIDTKGWAGNLSVLPYRKTYDKFKHWDWFVERINRNESKFEQPSASQGEIEPGYALFICQLPHDQTIQFHSCWSVSEALWDTIQSCKAIGKRLVVKGHPVNPASMEILKRIVQESNSDLITWVDDISIHTAIKNASHCITVNSGSGIEVILHKKPLFAYGKAEYSEVAFHGILPHFLNMSSVDEYDYRCFIESYVDSLYDVNDPTTFEKLFKQP